MFSTTTSARYSISSWVTNRQWGELLPQVVDRCLWSLVVLAPFAWGGRGEGAPAVYAVVASVTILAWLANAWFGRKQTIELSPLFAIPAIAVVWLAIQLTPLPAFLLEMLSPNISKLLTAWQGNGSLGGLVGGQWHTLSLHPAAGQVSLAVLLCHTMILFVAIQRIKSLGDVNMLLKWVAQAAVAVAAFGLLQYFTADGLFFWVFEHPFRRTDDFVCGPFINRNHFASFLAMGAMAIVYQLSRVEPKLKATHREPRSEVRDYSAMLWTLGLATVLLAMLMSASRGGVLAAVAGVLVLAVIYWRKQVWSSKQLSYMLLAVAMLGVGLSLYGEDRLTQRFEDITSGSVESMDQLGSRRAIWAANLKAISSFWLTGAGAGTHQNVYPLFIEKSFPKVFTHAENGYLQIATEIGLLGVLLLLGTLLCIARWAHKAWSNARSREEAACLGALLAGVVVSLVHSAFDFVWYIPATITTALLLVVMLRRLAHGDVPKQKATQSTGSVPYELALLVVCVIAYVGVVLGPPALSSNAWNRYRARSAQLAIAQQPAYEEMSDSGDPTGLRDASPILAAEIDALGDIIRANPNSAAAHLRLARAYLQWFDARSEFRESRMNVGQLQGAVWSNGFASSEAVTAWLTIAIGDELKLLKAAQHHAAEAIRLSPLEGLGYLCLANLDFLDNRSAEGSEPLIEQAATLRPQDGTVLFEIGKYNLLSGRSEQAIDAWVKCYGHKGRHRQLVIASLAGRLPAADFLQNFTPDWTTLRTVWQRYLAAGNPAELGVLLAYATEQVEHYEPGPRDTPTSYLWVWLGEMNGDVGNAEEQIACLERAMKLNPTFQSVRRAYGLALFHAERFAEAEPHLRWCVARDPANPGLRECLHRAAALQYRNAPSSTANSPLRHPIR